MENCYKMYTWMCRTIVALVLEMFWKMRQISDYFSQEESEENSKLFPLPSELAPLSKESKYRRHIRSMSDVQRSTPLHKIPVKYVRRNNSQPLIYDSDSRTRRLRLRSRYHFDSSDSHSECQDGKLNTVEEKLKRFTTSNDSMRYL